MNREEYKKYWRFVRLEPSVQIDPHFRDALHARQYSYETDKLWNYRRKAARLHRPDYSFAAHKGGYWLQICADQHVEVDEDGVPTYSYIYEYQRLDQKRENGKPLYGFGVYPPIATVPFECRIEAIHIIQRDEYGMALADVLDLRSEAWRARIVELVAEKVRRDAVLYYAD